jgi:hypothetical protein
MSGTTRSRLDLAFAALLSEDDVHALEALDRIGRDGDARAIPHLLNTLARSTSTAVRQRTTALLHQVKAPGAGTELLKALDDPALAGVRRDIVAVFWSAGIDVRDHLERFITLAIEGDAHLCFECLTVVENQEIWPEKAARLGLARVKKAATDERDPYKAAMLADLVQELEQRLGG